MRIIVTLPIVFLLILAGSFDIVQAEPQADLVYKLELLERAADLIGQEFRNDSKLRQSLEAELIRTAAKLGAAEFAVVKLNEFFGPEDTSRRRTLLESDLIEQLAGYGHLESCLSMFDDSNGITDGQIDTLDEMELFVVLAVICGRMGPEKEPFFRQLQSKFKIGTFRYVKTEAHFDTPEVLKDFTEVDKQKLIAEAQFAYVSGLLNSGHLNQARMEADEMSRGFSGEAARLLVLKFSENELGFPKTLVFDSGICLSNARLAQAKWNLANNQPLEAIRILVRDIPDAPLGSTTLVNAINAQAKKDPGLQALDESIRSAAAQRVVRYFGDIDDDEYINDVDELLDRSLTLTGSFHLHPAFIDDTFLASSEELVDSLLVFRSLREVVQLGQQLIDEDDEDVRNDFFETLLNHQLSKGDWDAAEICWNELLVQQGKESKASIKSARKRFEKQVVTAAMRLGQYDKVDQLIGRFPDTDPIHAAVTAWKKRKDGIEPAKEDVQQQITDLELELDKVTDDNRLKYLIDKAMANAWRLHRNVERLPLHDYYKKRILESGKPAEAISRLRNYQGSFTPPGQASMAFAQDLLSELVGEIEQLDREPGLRLSMLVQDLSRVVTDEYDPATRQFSRHKEKLINLASRSPQGESRDKEIARAVRFLSLDKDQDSIETLLALIESPAVKVRALQAVAEDYPPKHKPFIDPHVIRYRVIGGGGVF